MARRIKLTTKLRVEDLEQRYRRASEGMERSHWQIIWLLAQGHPAYQVAQMTGYAAYWIGQIARRYHDEGAEGLVNHRRISRPSPLALFSTPEQLEELRTALVGPAPHDDVWNSRTVAAWLSARAGRRVSAPAALHYLRYLRYLHYLHYLHYLRLLDFTPQAPRPRHTKAASPEERTAWKKSGRPR